MQGGDGLDECSRAIAGDRPRVSTVAAVWAVMADVLGVGITVCTFPTSVIEEKVQV